MISLRSMCAKYFWDMHSLKRRLGCTTLDIYSSVTVAKMHERVYKL